MSGRRVVEQENERKALYVAVAFVKTAAATATDTERLAAIGLGAHQTAERMYRGKEVAEVEKRMCEAIRRRSGGGQCHEGMAATPE